MPAQNTGPAWVSTITRTARSPIAESSAASSSRRNCADRALRLAGESRVIVPTPWATSRCTSSSAIPGTVGRGGGIVDQVRERAGRSTGRVLHGLRAGVPPVRPGLEAEQLVVGAAPGHQLVVPAELGDPAVLQHDDLVGRAD